MTQQMRSAIYDAMTLLRAANVGEATATLQRALAGGPNPTPPATSAQMSPKLRAPTIRRPLGEVLATLRAHRFEPDVRRAVPPEAETIADDHRFTAQRFVTAAGALDYKLYVPTAVAPTSLLVMLHGCTQNPDDFARGTRMNRLAEEFGVVVVYPHQPRTGNAQGCWNWFDPRHQHRGSGEPALLAGLARDVAGRHGIADDRVFAAGLSAGGAMADVLATVYPDVFAAVGIHSGLPAGAASDVMSAFRAMSGTIGAPTRTAAVGTSRKFIIHGAADPTVASANGERILDLLQQSDPAARSIRTAFTNNGRRVTRTLLDDPEGRPVAEHWLVDAAGHAWSGGDRKGSFTDETGPDASREMLRFFLAAPPAQPT